MKDVIEIKLTPQSLNEFNDGKEKFKLLGLSLAKETFKDKTKLCLLCLVPKPPWENDGTDFVLGILWTRQQKYSEMVVEGKFLEMAHLILCQKVTIVVLRTKKKILTRGRVSSNR